MSVQKHRITQGDIAAEAGVHQATVSLALKNHPSIPLKTRQKIQRLADKLGYLHDPMLSALAAYRNRSRPAVFHGTLAWLTDSSFKFDWRASPHYTLCFKGLADGAQRHGYQIAEFDVNASGMTSKRVASILRARNVSGVLLCPQPRPYTEMRFPWEDFSAVTFGYSLAKPSLHTIAAAFYRDMQQTIREVRRRGYQRIGLVLNFTDDERYDHNALAGFLVDEYLYSGSIPIPPFFENYRESPENLRAWIDRYCPDAIVSQDWRVRDSLHKVNIHPPKDLGLACAGIPQGIVGLSGVVENSQRLGEVAADFVTAMIQRGERGIPANVQRILVEGDWVPGSTLRDIASASSNPAKSRKGR